MATPMAAHPEGIRKAGVAKGTCGIRLVLLLLLQQVPLLQVVPLLPVLLLRIGITGGPSWWIPCLFEAPQRIQLILTHG